MTHVDRRASQGAVYTPTLLADFAASLLVDRLDGATGRVLDPACGDGELLAAVARLRPVRLLGLDCDAGAVQASRSRLAGATITQVDALLWLTGPTSVAGVITNPPWGAELPAGRPALAQLGYRVDGQVDSWDLFVEGLLRVTSPGVPMVLILPDALFLPEHAPIRRRLLREATLDQILRLGEGLFPGVSRGVVVVALRRGEAAPGHRVRCARMSPAARKRVLAGALSLDQALADGHWVAQSRFQSDAEGRFDIDVRDADAPVLARIEAGASIWPALQGARGVELSKSGRVARCTQCAHTRPWPRSLSECPLCGAEWEQQVAETLVSTHPGDGWRPLIVGEDVGRHRCQASRWLRTGVPGIQYKDPRGFTGCKLLVRKTGVGIKAAVDRTEALTTQVVYAYKSRPSEDLPAFALDYVAGVLCSRVMLAWHLKRNGESEWRSHPYVTQAVIERFPVPDPRIGGRLRQAEAIAHAVAARRSASTHDGPEDLRIERLVGGLFELTEQDMRWTMAVLDEAQGLEPIRSLRLAGNVDVTPLHVRG